MIKQILFGATILLAACSSETTNTTTTAVADTTAAEDSGAVVDEYITGYVVVADTNQDYYVLHKKMFELNKQLEIPIDTMDRTYNAEKKMITLPENSEDESYAGSYYPRRNPSEDLSLEYTNYYDKVSSEKCIALVTGIYESEVAADSALSILKRVEKNAYKIKARLYMGCMH